MQQSMQQKGQPRSDRMCNLSKMLIIGTLSQTISDGQPEILILLRPLPQGMRLEVIPEKIAKPFLKVQNDLKIFPNKLENLQNNLKIFA